MTETTDDRTQANQDTYTVYGYGTGNAATQQTRKTVHLGDDATDPVIEDDTYTYNLQGRMASAEVEKYDSTGQTLTEHTKSEYKYDDDGIRVEQKVSTDVNLDGDFTDAEDTVETTKYLNDGNNPTGYSQVLEERVAGQLTKAVTLGLDVLAQWAAAIANGGNLFLLKDGHDSTRMSIDATGQPLSGQVYRYDAFGNAIGFNPTLALTRFLYSGEQTDSWTGLQYLRARFYDPGTGRFNRLDPWAGDLLSPLSLNKYLYCMADGVNGIDPTGQFTLVEVVVVLGILALILACCYINVPSRYWDAPGAPVPRTPSVRPPRDDYAGWVVTKNYGDFNDDVEVPPWLGNPNDSVGTTSTIRATIRFGCGGVCAVRANYFSQLPHRKPGTRCFTNRNEAMRELKAAHQGGTRALLIAVQTDVPRKPATPGWTPGPPRDNGLPYTSEVEVGQIDVDNTDTRNWASLVDAEGGSTWEWANHGSWAAHDGKGDFVIRHFMLLPGAPYNYTTYCVVLNSRDNSPEKFP